jgi:hypothetical protein
METLYCVAAAVGFLLVSALGMWNLVASWFHRKFPKYPWVQRGVFEGVNSNTKSAQWLEDRLNIARDSVRIVSGHLHPDVYDGSAEIVKRRLTDEPGLRVWILTGPEILTKSDGTNALFDLATDEGFRNQTDNRLLIRSLEREPVQHFRVVDRAHVYVEEPHDPSSEERTIHSMDYAFWKGWQYYRAFDLQWGHPGLPVSRIRKTTMGCEQFPA